MPMASRRRFVGHLAGLWGGALALRAAAGEADAPALPRIGSALQVPTLPLLGGGNFDPQQARGQLLVLYWWASWCPFCAIQSPLMEKLWIEHKARGLLLLGLSIDRSADVAQAYRAQRGFTFASAWLPPQATGSLVKPRGLPVTCVLGRGGRVVLAEGGQLFPEDIEQIARFL